jgi:hypothetical protein
MSNSSIDPDRDLRDRFQALRRSEAASAPAFGSAMLPSHRREKSPRKPGSFRARLAVATAGLATLVAITAILIAKRESRIPSLEKAIAQAREMSAWSAPTDALLVTTDLKIPDSIPKTPAGSVTSGEGSNPTIQKRLD